MLKYIIRSFCKMCVNLYFCCSKNKNNTRIIYERIQMEAEMLEKSQLI